MNVRRMAGVVLVAGCCLTGQGRAAAQCCLTDLFAGCSTCFRKAPVYAVAPMAPVAAPIMAPPVMAPVAAPPPPVMVPMQQTSYVPETTYRTEYKCVPVTTYKPSCEIDPCTGCQVECMQPVTQYVQQAVNVPVTQYRAVTTTKYVQVQPGYGAAPGYAPVAPGMPAAAAPAASPFSAVQTTPQAWGAAGADVSRQPVPGVAPPALPPATVTPAPTYQYQQPSPPAYQYQQPAAAQPVIPQTGTYAPPQQYQPQLQPTEPPALSPAPSLKPIPELPRGGQTNGTPAGNGAAAAGASGESQGTAGGAAGSGYRPPAGSDAFGTPSRQESVDQPGMPVLPGSGPGAATGAFPRLLEPTSHTTSWGPSDGGPAGVQYPTAALPAWRQAQH
jgi:hypothetical protein